MVNTSTEVIRLFDKYVALREASKLEVPGSEGARRQAEEADRILESARASRTPAGVQLFRLILNYDEKQFVIEQRMEEEVERRQMMMDAHILPFPEAKNGKLTMREAASWYNTEIKKLKKEANDKLNAVREATTPGKKFIKLYSYQLRLGEEIEQLKSEIADLVKYSGNLQEILAKKMFCNTLEKIRYDMELRSQGFKKVLENSNTVDAIMALNFDKVQCDEGARIVAELRLPKDIKMTLDDAKRIVAELELPEYAPTYADVEEQKATEAKAVEQKTTVQEPDPMADIQAKVEAKAETKTEAKAGNITTRMNDKPVPTAEPKPASRFPEFPKFDPNPKPISPVAAILGSKPEVKAEEPSAVNPLAQPEVPAQQARQFVSPTARFLDTPEERLRRERARRDLEFEAMAVEARACLFRSKPPVKAEEPSVANPLAQPRVPAQQARQFVNPTVRFLGKSEEQLRQERANALQLELMAVEARACLFRGFGR